MSPGNDVALKESLTLRISGGPTAPSRARTALRSLERTLEELNDDVSLLVSELVTNSVRHGFARTEDAIGIAAIISANRVRIEVTDDGPGFDRSELERHHEVGGFGLELVDRLTNRWGFTRDPQACVWFEIDRVDNGSSRPRNAPEAPRMQPGPPKPSI
jgi:anti-sigma regulatory factor (Ser/Thr protein kinase)